MTKVVLTTPFYSCWNVVPEHCWQVFCWNIYEIHHPKFDQLRVQNHVIHHLHLWGSIQLLNNAILWLPCQFGQDKMGLLGIVLSQTMFQQHLHSLQIFMVTPSRAINLIMGGGECKCEGAVPYYTPSQCLWDIGSTAQRLDREEGQTECSHC